jgi:hypothetical protein
LVALEHNADHILRKLEEGDPVSYSATQKWTEPGFLQQLVYDEDGVTTAVERTREALHGSIAQISVGQTDLRWIAQEDLRRLQVNGEAEHKGISGQFEKAMYLGHKSSINRSVNSDDLSLSNSVIGLVDLMEHNLYPEFLDQTDYEPEVSSDLVDLTYRGLADDLSTMIDCQVGEVESRSVWNITRAAEGLARVTEDNDSVSEQKIEELTELGELASDWHTVHVVAKDRTPEDTLKDVDISQFE